MVSSFMPIGSSREEEAAVPGFAELSLVALTHAVEVEGRSLPERALGTIVAA